MILLFLAFSLLITANSQCLSGYRLIKDECVPDGTTSTFLMNRPTHYRFLFEDSLQDSSGNGLVLNPTGEFIFDNIPSSTNRGIRTGSPMTISNVLLGRRTCFHTRFYWFVSRSNVPLVAVSSPVTPNTNLFTILVTPSGKVQIRSQAGLTNSKILVKRNTLNNLSLCFRPNNRIVLAHNGVRYGTFTHVSLMNTTYNIALGSRNAMVIDEAIAFSEDQMINYDVSLLFSQVGKHPYRSLGFFTTGVGKTAAFTFIGNSFGKNALYVTHFGGPAGGTIEVLADVAPKLNSLNSFTTTTVASGIIWPNKAIDVPSEVFGDNFLITSGGFLTPFARTGAIHIINLNDGNKYMVSTTETNFYYHMTVWFDVDQDGLLDIITAKTQFPVSFARRLVWLKNPGTFTFPWQEFVLIPDGGDVFFRLHDFDNDGRMEIVSSIAFGRKLSIFKNIGTGDYSNPAEWTERVIEQNIGLVFDVKVEDMNMDGKVDLLVTNHVGLLNSSAVYVYEVPSDILTGNYPRHTIAINVFKTTQPGTGQASPGSPFAFRPVVADVQEKPYVFVSGDGTQRGHLLIPLSRNPSNWDYDVKEVFFGNNTIGGVSVGDVDGDGYSEMFAPIYEVGQVVAFTFAP